jgi:threonine dehydratase
VIVRSNKRESEKGVAVAAALLGCSAIICMPVTTPAIKVGSSDFRSFSLNFGVSVIVRSKKGEIKQGEAVAAALLGCIAIICMPVTTPAIKVGIFDLKTLSSDFLGLL